MSIAIAELLQLDENLEDSGSIDGLRLDELSPDAILLMTPEKGHIAAIEVTEVGRLGCIGTEIGESNYVNPELVDAIKVEPNAEDPSDSFFTDRLASLGRLVVGRDTTLRAIKDGETYQEIHLGRLMDIHLLTPSAA